MCMSQSELTSTLRKMLTTMVTFFIPTAVLYLSYPLSIFPLKDKFVDNKLAILPKAYSLLQLHQLCVFISSDRSSIHRPITTFSHILLIHQTQLQLVVAHWQGIICVTLHVAHPTALKHIQSTNERNNSTIPLKGQGIVRESIQGPSQHASHILNVVIYILQFSVTFCALLGALQCAL